MTRKEIATAIATAQIAKQGLTISVAKFAFYLLNGVGYSHPYNKPELERWYNNLVIEGSIVK